MKPRVRRHANPFHVQVELGPLDVSALFGREAPLEIELGSGGGRFLLTRAKNHPERNFVGFEVREPLVDYANELAVQEGLKNARIFYANANANLEGLVPKNTVDLFHVHFPDPWFKKRHFKRRMIQSKSVRAMAELLKIGGRIYAQSDVRALAEEMYAFFSSEDALAPLTDQSMLVPRPIEEATEWELQHERENAPIYRMLFEKRNEPTGEIKPVEFRKVL